MRETCHERDMRETCHERDMRETCHEQAFEDWHWANNAENAFGAFIHVALQEVLHPNPSSLIPHPQSLHPTP